MTQLTNRDYIATTYVDQARDHLKHHTPMKLKEYLGIDKHENIDIDVLTIAATVKLQFHYADAFLEYTKLCRK
jgi:hypothetical protein